MTAYKKEILYLSLVDLHFVRRSWKFIFQEPNIFFFILEGNFQFVELQICFSIQGFQVVYIDVTLSMAVPVGEAILDFIDRLNAIYTVISSFRGRNVCKEIYIYLTLMRLE